MAMVEGRGFRTDGFTGDVSEAVISRGLAQELWPGEDPLHHTIRVESAWGVQFTVDVVGVAEDVRLAGLTSTADPTVYLPLKGNVFTLSFPLYFLARGAESPRPVAELVGREAASSMPSVAVNSSYRVDSQLRQAFIEQEARVWFSTAGAILIAAIAYVGLYGVLLHSVNSKRREMAIRLCLGAKAGHLGRMVIRQALQCSLAGAAIALLAWWPIAALAARSWLGKMEISRLSLAAILLLCVATALGISLVPASTAAGISPAEMLREQ